MNTPEAVRTLSKIAEHLVMDARGTELKYETGDFQRILQYSVHTDVVLVEDWTSHSHRIGRYRWEGFKGFEPEDGNAVVLIFEHGGWQTRVRLGRINGPEVSVYHIAPTLIAHEGTVS